MIRIIVPFAVLLVALTAGAGVPAVLGDIKTKVTTIESTVKDIMDLTVFNANADRLASAVPPDVRNATCFCLALDTYLNEYCVQMTADGLRLAPEVRPAIDSIRWDTSSNATSQMLPDFFRGVSSSTWFSHTVSPNVFHLAYKHLHDRRDARMCTGLTGSYLQAFDNALTYGVGVDGLHVRLSSGGSSVLHVKVATNGPTASSIAKFPQLCSGLGLSQIWNASNFSDPVTGTSAQRAYWGKVYANVYEAYLGQSCCGGQLSFLNGTTLPDVNACIGGTTSPDCRCPAASGAYSVVSPSLITDIGTLCANYLKSSNGSVFYDEWDVRGCGLGRVIAKPWNNTLACVGGSAKSGVLCT